MNRPPMHTGQPGSVPSPIQHQNSPLQQHPNIQTTHRPAMMPQQSMITGMQSGHGGMAQMMAQQQHLHPQMSMLPAVQPKQYWCRVGADTVQDIVTKALELFQHLRSMTPQFTSTNQQCEDKKNKIKETAKYLENSFKKLRKIYEVCNDEVCSTMDFVDPKSLLPLKDDEDSDEEKEKVSDGLMDDRESSTGNQSIKNDLEKNKLNPKYQQLEKDYRDMVELNKLKNRQLKEIIDRMRKMVWDINTMLAMRRP